MGYDFSYPKNFTFQECKKIRSNFINAHDVERLRKCLSSDEWLPLQLSLETGLRIGDVLSLRADQLTADQHIQYVASKTGKAGIAAISKDLFLRIIAQKWGKNALKSNYFLLFRPDQGYLFPGRGKTGHLTRQAAWARMKRAAARAGIDATGISPHSLRKCFAVALRHSDGIAAVKAALQHDNEIVTHIYAYADSVMQGAPDEPMRWRDLEMLAQYILDRCKKP